jgi:hypothetical protein
MPTIFRHKLKAYLTLLFFLWQDREISRCSNSGSCLQRGWQQSLQTGGHPNWIPSYRLVFPPSTEIVLWQMLRMSSGRYSTRLSMTCLCNISEMNYASGKHRAFECAHRVAACLILYAMCIRYLRLRNPGVIQCLGKQCLRKQNTTVEILSLSRTVSYRSTLPFQLSCVLSR